MRAVVDEDDAVGLEGFISYTILDDDHKIIGVMTVPTDALEFTVMRMATAVAIARRPTTVPSDQ